LTAAAHERRIGRPQCKKSAVAGQQLLVAERIRHLVVAASLTLRRADSERGRHRNFAFVTLP
jgi:hypothetical protein